jgi:ribosomal protein S18 acetylase RimI-like enzyme
VPGYRFKVRRPAGPPAAHRAVSDEPAGAWQPDALRRSARRSFQPVKPGSSGARFRRAHHDDVPAVVDLVESAYRGERSRSGWTTEADLLGGQRTDTDEIASLIAADDCRLLIAVDEHAAVVGCCHLRRRAGEVGYFGTFAVRPGLQGSGLGTALLTEAERCARQEWGVRRMRMTVISQRAELIAWYQRRGYRPTGEIEPFPYGDERAGRPLRADLEFCVLEKDIAVTTVG